MADLQFINEIGIIGTALIRRDGTLEESLLPENIDKETFSIMCATIYGGATTVYTEMNYKEPLDIVIYGKELNLVIFPNSSRDFWVLLIPTSMDPSKAREEFIARKK
jgi:predicted regulator of Ras-like GTPase activity (Roadblock/LC7/MglB family)